ncbi:MAG: hypothetical protein V2A66_04940 [Pseudomonadota bacterium]
MNLSDGQIEVIDDDVALILQNKTPWERLAIANGMWKSARTLIGASIRHMHPDWNEEHVMAEVANRMLHGTH